MKEQLLDIFAQYPQMAILISLLVSIIVAVLGLIPSVFITAANILFFGFWPGTLISLAGEAIGAAIAFLLYRFGFKKTTHRSLEKYPKIMRLVDSKGKDAFMLILILRLIPFVPSGLVTFAAAIGEVSVVVFFAASTLGKIPALLIEAYSVAQIAEFNWQGKLILLITVIVLLWWVVRGRMKKGKGESQGGSSV